MSNLGGEELGFGIGLGGPRWKEQRKFASRALNILSEGQKGTLLTYLLIFFS